MLLQRMLGWLMIGAAFGMAPTLAVAQIGIETTAAPPSHQSDAKSVVMTKQGSRRETATDHQMAAGSHGPARVQASGSDYGDLPLCSPMEVMLAAARAVVLTVACREPNGSCGSDRPGDTPAQCVIAKGKLP